MKITEVKKPKSSNRPIISQKFPAEFFKPSLKKEEAISNASSINDTKKLTKVLKHLNRMPDQSTEKLFEPYSLSSTATQISTINFSDLVTLSQKNRKISVQKTTVHSQTLELYTVHQVALSSRGKKKFQDFIENWQLFNHESFVKIINSKWNQPEGCLSLICQHFSGCTLEEIWENTGSVPESVLNPIALSLLKVVKWVQTAQTDFKIFEFSQILCTKENGVRLVPSLSPEEGENSLMESLGKVLIRSVVFEEIQFSEKKCCFFHSLKEDLMFKKLSRTFNHFLCKLTRFGPKNVDELMNHPWILSKDFSGPLVDLKDLVKIASFRAGCSVERVCNSLRLAIGEKKCRRPRNSCVERLADELGVRQGVLEVQLCELFDERVYVGYD